MAYEERLVTISVEAAADLSSSQYRFVQINSSGQMALSGTAEQPDGVLQDDPDAASEVGEMAISGVTKIVCAGALTAGTRVTSDSEGRATAAASGDEISGVMLEDASGTGSIAAMLLKLK